MRGDQSLTNGNYLTGVICHRGNSSGSTIFSSVAGFLQGGAGTGIDDDIVTAGFFADGAFAGTNHWALYISGRAFQTSSAWTASDKNLKKNILPISAALQSVNNLKLYT